MKVLVTGYRGFIASYMVEALRGHTIKVMDWQEDYPDVEGLDWVIHMGAISSTTERNVEKVMLQNYDFTTQLYEDCKKHGVNMQFSSSASVYGLGTNFKEDAPVDPKTPYAWSKFMCEKYIQEHPGDITVQMFRYFNVYGPQGEAHKGSQASPFYQFEKQAVENGVINVFKNSAEYKRDFIHASEVANYHKKFFNVKKSGVFNIGEGKTMSFMDVAEQIAVKHKARINFIEMPEILKSSYQAYTCADMTKTKEALYGTP